MGTLYILDNVVLNAIDAYELDTAVDGLTNLRAIFEKNGNVKFKGKERIPASCEARNMSEKSLDTVLVPLKLDVWAAIGDDILANFSNKAGAQFAMPLIFPPFMLRFDQFNLVGNFYEDTVNAGAIQSVRFCPNLARMFNTVGTAGVKDGFYGNETKGVILTRGVNTTLVANVKDSFDTVDFTFDILDSVSGVLQAGLTASVSNDTLTLTAAPSAGASDSGIVVLNEAIYRTAASSPALRMNVNLAHIPGVDIVFPLGLITV